MPLCGYCIGSGCTAQGDATSFVLFFLHERHTRSRPSADDEPLLHAWLEYGRRFVFLMNPACMPTRHREVMKCADSERYASARTARVSVVSAAACCSALVWAVPAARQRGLHAMGLVVGMPAAFADEHAGMEQAGQGACLGKALALACEIALAALGIRPLRCGVSYAACKTTWEFTPAWQARIAGETARAGRAGLYRDVDARDAGSQGRGHRCRRMRAV